MSLTLNLNLFIWKKFVQLTGKYFVVVYKFKLACSALIRIKDKPDKR